ncbi:MAG: hypothetical protein OXJ55_05690 [Caldilineaceae bacterium]|nr:hypothetical protein [Caldilineaceae bacterium]MDE0463794.1 hypothetical protein [Caldilineaceae bacterium]
MLPIFLLDNEWVILFIPLGIWTAFFFKYFFAQWLEKVDWVKPRSRRFTINTASALTFALAALLFGKVSIVFFLAFMVTSVWVVPLFEHMGSESK